MSDLSGAFGPPAVDQLRGLLPTRRGDDAGSPDGAPRGPGPATTDRGGPDEHRAPDGPGDEVRPADEEVDVTVTGRARAAGDEAGDVAGDVTTGHEGRARRPRAGTDRTGSGAPRRRDAGGGSGDRAPAAQRPRRAAEPAPHAPAGGHRWGPTRITSREHADLLVLAALGHGPEGGTGIVERIRTDSGGALVAPEGTVYRTLHRLTRNRLLRRTVLLGGRTGWALTALGERALTTRARGWTAYTRAVDAVVRAAGTR